MLVQQQQLDSESAKSNATLHPVVESRHFILTVCQFAKRNPAFSEAALRNLIFKAGSRHSTKGEIHGNGLIEAGAIIRVGRKVLIDEECFFTWVKKQNGGA